MAMLDQPAPQATSATRAGGSASKPPVDVGDRGQPLRAEQIGEERPVDIALRLARRARPKSSQDTPPPMRKASSMAGSVCAKDTP